MSLGLAEQQGNLFDGVGWLCEQMLAETSVYAMLHRERDRLFPDEMFADLFSTAGRRSVPPSVVAVVMVLQRLDGLSDREAVERFCFDARWRYATGVGGYDCYGQASFSHTVLVDMRERLRRSVHPNRIMDVGLDAARQAGVIGRQRVLDSTPLYDAVATMDTITLIRSAIRSLLKVASPDLAREMRCLLTGGDDYASSAKPQVDWDDAEAREQLVDSRAKDAFILLAFLDGTELDENLSQAARLLASVVGQDLEEGDDGIFRIARRVAQDRVISTVDPEARHGHKTAARGFDGYKGHVAVDPDSEIITATVVTPGNAGDASAAEDLIGDLIGPDQAEKTDDAESAGDRANDEDKPVVYGDNAYGTGPFQETLEQEGIDSRCKTQEPAGLGGLFSKNKFKINLRAGTVTCPAGVTVTIGRRGDGGGAAIFGEACATCPLREQCTKSPAGRTIRIHPREEVLHRARQRQSDPEWQADYRATRPKVERKLAHLMFRRHGGRRARVRGTEKVDADFRLLAAAANLARLARLGLRSAPNGAWVTA